MRIKKNNNNNQVGPSASHDVVLKWFSNNVKLASMPHEYARDELNGDPQVAPGSKTGLVEKCLGF